MYISSSILILIGFILVLLLIAAYCFGHIMAYNIVIKEMTELIEKLIDPQKEVEQK